MPGQTFAYLRVSKLDQDLEKNKADILKLANDAHLGHVQFIERGPIKMLLFSSTYPYFRHRKDSTECHKLQIVLWQSIPFLLRQARDSTPFS
jgi:hypothetical protein